MKLVEGVGINDSADPVWVNGQNIPSYSRWKDMLRRCYNTTFQSKQPTYVGCSVHSDWLSFSSFKSWFDANYTPGYYLDKDLLVFGNKQYSPNTCIFVPEWLNNFITDSAASRGSYLIGVSWHKGSGKFISRCCNPQTGKTECLGYFVFENDAHQKWKERKREHIELLRVELDAIDTRLYPALKKRYM